MASKRHNELPEAEALAANDTVLGWDTSAGDDVKVPLSLIGQWVLETLADDFQPLDSDLTAIAALSTTAFGRNLLTLADQAALQEAVGSVGGGGSGFVAQTDAPEDTTLLWYDTDEPATGGLLPTGGTTGQVVAKASSANYDVEWVDPAWINVKSYGAVGDGVTDDTAAVEAAIAAIATVGGTVFFPAGDYRLSPIVFPEGVSVKGAGAGRYQSGAAKGTVLRPLPGETTGTLVTMDGDYTTIADLAIDGTALIQDGLRLNGARSFASRLIVQSTTRDGIVLDAVSTYGTKVDSIWVLDCGRYGLFNEQVSDAQFSNIWVGRCTTAQIRFGATNCAVSNVHAWTDDYTSTGIQMRGSHYRMTNVYAESCAIGLDFYNASYNSLANVNCWANTSRGINLIGTSKHNTVAGGTIYNNGNGGVLIGETASYNLLSGLHFYDDEFSSQAYAVTVNLATNVGNRIVSCFALDADAAGGTAIIDNGTDTVIDGVSGLTLEEVRDDLASVLVAGSNITITPNDAADTITIAAASSSVVATEVEVPLSSFAGADDDAKLAAFMSYAAAQTYRGITCLLDENRLYQFSTTQNLYSGFSIKGTARPQDQARSSMPIGQRVDINMTNNGWFALNQAQTFGVSIQGMSIDGTSTNRLVQGHASNVLWTSVFRDLSLQNIQNVLGSVSQPLLVTACTIDGWWNVNNLYAPGFNLSGSDFFFVPSTMLIDSEPAFRAVDSYLMNLDYLSNTHVKHLYMTCEESSGILIDGNSSNGCLWITDSVIEGRNNTEYCAGALIKHTGGTSVFRDLRLANAMGNPTIAGGNNDQGVIHVSGGNLTVSGCIYEKQTGVAESTPFIYVTGASTRVRVRDIITFDHTWTGKPVVYQTQTGLVDADDSVTVVTA